MKSQPTSAVSTFNYYNGAQARVVFVSSFSSSLCISSLLILGPQLLLKVDPGLNLTIVAFSLSKHRTLSSQEDQKAKRGTPDTIKSEEKVDASRIKPSWTAPSRS